MRVDFWRFSLAFYEAPGCREVLLDLQDDQGADVNVVLFCLWCATDRKRISCEQLGDLEAACEAWRDKIIAPARSMRVWLRDPAHNLAPEPALFRQSVKRLELEAERAQQLHMVELSSQWAFAPADDEIRAAEDNLDCYLDGLKTCSIARGSLPRQRRVLEETFAAYCEAHLSP